MLMKSTAFANFLPPKSKAARSNRMLVKLKEGLRMVIELLTLASLLVRVKLKSDPALTFVAAESVEALVFAAVLLRVGALIVF